MNTWCSTVDIPFPRIKVDIRDCDDTDIGAIGCVYASLQRVAMYATNDDEKYDMAVVFCNSVLVHLAYNDSVAPFSSLAVSRMLLHG